MWLDILVDNPGQFNKIHHEYNDSSSISRRMIGESPYIVSLNDTDNDSDLLMRDLDTAN
jgi:hypothetical protein